MKHHVNFTPGPSQLYFTVHDHMREAFREKVPSLSHRSQTFERIVEETTAGLRQLLSIPSDFQIFFAASATEIWERTIQNLVKEYSFHLVNGAFSKRFFEVSLQLGKRAGKTEVKPGSGFDRNLSIPEETELVAITHNETSTGVSLPAQLISTWKDQYPDTLLAIDAVSSLPYPAFDFSKFDTIFFSVQKGFGLPAGLGVWIVNERCLTKADELLAGGAPIGSYHSLPTLKAHAAKNQTPETPNVLGIFLLNKVVQDFLRRGITTLRRETEYKAAILYQALEQHPLLSPFVTEKSLQSKTVIVAECGMHTDRLSAFLLDKGLAAGDGYGPAKKNQLRFANFPAHSKEQFELLVDAIVSFR